MPREHIIPLILVWIERMSILLLFINSVRRKLPNIVGSRQHIPDPSKTFNKLNWPIALYFSSLGQFPTGSLYTTSVTFWKPPSIIHPFNFSEIFHDFPAADPATSSQYVHSWTLDGFGIVPSSDTSWIVVSRCSNQPPGLRVLYASW